MFRRILTPITVALAVLAGSALAAPAAGFASELPAYLECVPYARAVSGIQIYGDAYTWWDQAEGRYARGRAPQAGAVMAFAPYGNMRLGHVAAVSRVIDSRNVLLRHANWSPIGGTRGQVEVDVRAVDVSPGNDWSQVRVWYDPLQNLGTTAWPVQGFIYPARGGAPSMATAQRAVAAPTPQPVRPSREFLNAFADLAAPAAGSKPAARSAPAGSKPVDLLASLARNK